MRRLGLRIAGVLIEARWLHGARASAIGAVLLSAWILCLGLLLWRNLVAPGAAGTPDLARDFASFWTAGELALRGDPAAVYRPALHQAAQTALYAGTKSGYAAFFYPPVFLLACVPLALLPFGAACVAFVVVSGALYVAAMRPLLPRGASVVALLAYPAVFINTAFVQNGVLSAGLFALAASLLQRQPILAGISFGALVYKPQMGLLIPVALAAAGRWRAFAAAAATVLLLSAASMAAFGIDAWRGFLAISPTARQWMQDGSMGFDKMVSVFAAVRILGGSVGVAYAAQAVVALAAIVLLAGAVRRRPGAFGETAALVSATLVATPFALQYDLVVLAVPMAWLLSEAVRTDWLPCERLALAAIYLSPFVIAVVAGSASIPLGPLATGGLFALVLRRLSTRRIDAYEHQ